MAVCASDSNRAALKLVGRRTCSTLTGSSGGRNACGSGLHSVMSFGSKASHTAGSVKLSRTFDTSMPGTRARYGSGGMFMIDMQGTRAFATDSSSSRTPGERYCGSCIASATRS